MVRDIRVKTIATRQVLIEVTTQDGRPAAGTRVVSGPETSVTDALGRARLQVPSAASAVQILAMSARRDALGTASLSKSDSTARIRLEPKTPLRGTVQDADGKPVAGLQLYFIPYVQDSKIMSGLGVQIVGTDSEGRFEFHGFRGLQYLAQWERKDDIKRGYVPITWNTDVADPIKVERLQLDPSIFEGSLCRSSETRLARISSFALDPDGNAIVCDEEGKKIIRVSPDDRLLASWNVDFPPQAVDVRQDGTILVGGHSVIALLHPDGAVKKTGKIGQDRTITAITHSGSDVFVCVSGDAGFAVYRMTDDLTAPKRIISGLSGCCGQLDIRAYDGHIYVAENTRFTVGKYTFDGKKVASYTHNDPKKPSYYGEGCCEPKNICFGRDGTLYAAASSPMEVRRYRADGTFLGKVGKLPDADGSCVRVTLGVSKDSSRVYILDTANNVIRLIPQDRK